MARGINLADLAALANDATLVADQEIAATEHDVHRRKVQSLINSLLTAVRDKESCYAGAGAPIGKKQGKAYFDTDDSLWKGYHANAGTPAVLLDAPKAYAQAIGNAGTDTSKIGGTINADATGVVWTAPDTGVEFSYTVPANTLSADGDIARFIYWNDVGTNPPPLSVKFGASAIGTYTTAPAALVIATVIRNSAGSQKAVLDRKIYLDSAGATVTDFVQTATLTEDETVANKFSLTKTGIGGSITIGSGIWLYNR